ncbi:MAG: pilin [Minisyncoccia bacterium]
MKYLLKITPFVGAFFFAALVAHAQQNTGFVPLAEIKGLTDTATVSQGLPFFLRSLYTFCIGAAVVLAVIQIIRGGIEYMGGESVTNKEQGRNHITQAILGLILVLSPVIVFGIINKDITTLRFAVDENLTIHATSTSQGSGNTDQQCRVYGAGKTYLEFARKDFESACCVSQGCKVENEVIANSSIRYSCNCGASPSAPSCTTDTQNFSEFRWFENSCQSLEAAGEGGEWASSQCCVATSPSNTAVCCGKKR